MKRMIGRALLAGGLAAGVWAYGAARVSAEAPASLPPMPSGAGLFPSSDGIVAGFTLPHKEYKISFPTMGVIREVKVKEGDAVNAGDVLMIQDDREEQAELKVLEFDANSKKPEDAARAELELNQVKLKWEKDLLAQGGQNQRAVAEAEAQTGIAAIKVEQAIQERAQYGLKRDKQKTRIDRMSITSPSDGIVQSIKNDVGANGDPQRESIVVVQNNPLKVEVQVPAMASLSMKKGDKLKVSYDRKTWVDADVSMMSPQANAGSGTRMVHLELKNADHAPSGLQIYVDLREKLATAGR
ncbi:MAG: efflux RND transporter periplasmic adaptor subunit [Phycisphaerae bacterium]|nr:HlyD family efflux transporter periplasmic adaptor subunit [Tepidisphaeraceae bacterium]